MLTGTCYRSIDDDGTLEIPEQFRDYFIRENRGTCTVSLGFGRSVLLHDLESWASYQEKIYNIRGEGALYAKMAIIGSAEFESIKETSRITLHSDVRAKVGIIKDVVLIGMGKCVHVYAKEVYDEMVEEHEGNYEEWAEPWGVMPSPTS